MFENAQWGKVRATVMMKYKGKDERLIERGDGYKCWCASFQRQTVRGSSTTRMKAVVSGSGVFVFEFVFVFVFVFVFFV